MDIKPPHPIESVVPTEEQRTRMDIVRGAARVFHDTLASVLPEGRLKSLALTALEQCAMWAIKAITHTPS